jgi:hypothetical protein
MTSQYDELAHIIEDKTKIIKSRTQGLKFSLTLVELEMANTSSSERWDYLDRVKSELWCKISKICTEVDKEFQPKIQSITDKVINKSVDKI